MAKNVTPPSSQRVDWEAIERDHATGKYTDGELATKHGLARETIWRRRKTEQKKDPRRWAKNLTKQVREATQALLAHAEVTKQITGTITAGHTATAVLVAAEMSKSVILQHRSELQEARSLAMSLLAEVKQSGELVDHKALLTQILAGEDADKVDANLARRAVERALETGSRVSSAKALAETLTKLHAGERVAFSLDDEEGEKPDAITERSDEDIDRRIHELLGKT